MQEAGARLPIIESLILSAPEPLASRKIADLLDDVNPSEVDKIVEELNLKYRDNDLSFRIRKIAGGYQMYIIEDYARYVEDLLTRRRNVRLTRAALETLAITAYRQPVTKTDIEMIRGVASDSVIQTLMARRLVTLAGRADSVGRPLLYKTTDEFLKFFNLNSLNDLPRMEEIEELLAANEPTTQPLLPLDGEETPPNVEDSENEQQSTSLPDNAVSKEPPARTVSDSSTDLPDNQVLVKTLSEKGPSDENNDVADHPELPEKPDDIDRLPELPDHEEEDTAVSSVDSL